ncbi:MAG: glycosyltransferase family 4 protein [Kiritimatiellaeota bacterium]|nr:glycosyltransferase family 4 protein [Kiritimatiellota bacterium]
MRIIQLTPGTGNFYCGSCLHDNALVRALRARGHDALMVPLYLPFVVEDPALAVQTPIFLGGLSIFIAQKFPGLRRVPAWLNHLFSSPALLRQLARFAGMTSARDLGESTLSMLRGEHGRQAGELDRLVEWLRPLPPPDVICLSNSLLAGMARKLKEAFHCPIVCTLQGEAAFLDDLAEPYRQPAWDLLTQRAAEVDHFIAVSGYFGDQMRERLHLDAARVTVIHPGIAVENFAPATTPPAAPTIGYLARMHPTKGLATLVDAFLLLKKEDSIPGLRLRIAGAQTGGDERFVKMLARKIFAQGQQASVDWLPNLDRTAKAEFLRSPSVFSVPATYGEAFGLYVIEVLASGVPVVQPRHGAFPEVVAATGGGVLCEPDNPAALAAALRDLLLDPTHARQLGAAGRAAVQKTFSIEVMARKTEELLQRIAARSR